MGSLSRVLRMILGSNFSISAREEGNCSLSFVPEQCSCYNVNRLMCRSRGLKRLPDLPEEITRLFISNNSIQEIASDSFKGLTALKLLRFQRNKLRVIHDSALADTDLVMLYLGGNRLQNISDNAFKGLRSLKYLDLAGNEIRHVSPNAFDDLESVTLIDLHNNNLVVKEGDVIPMGPNTLYLDMSGNFATHLGPHAFEKGKNLIVLMFNDNIIHSIHPDAFHGLHQLADLNLTNNEIRSLPENLFIDCLELESLHLGYNPIQHFPNDLFQKLLNLKQVSFLEMTLDDYTLDILHHLPNLCYAEFRVFRYCLHVPSTKVCFPRSDGISSIESLLNMNLLRASIWVVAIATCFGNVLVLVGRILVREENLIHSMFIKNLCMADFLMGVYLIIIAIQDAKTRENYIYEALPWQQSWLCSLSGTLAMISCEVSVFILTFMSIDRYIIITNPYTSKQLSKKRAAMCLCFIWMFGALLAGIPFMSRVWFGDFYGSNGLCFPLHIHEPYEVGWQYSAFLFVGLNFFSILVIGFCYGAMLRNILSTRQGCHSNQGEDLSFARRFFLIVLTDAACWIPIIIIKFLAFSAIRISDEAYAWIAVFVLPVNSALNPILYSLSTLSFRRRLALALVERNRSRMHRASSSSSATMISRRSNSRVSAPLAPSRPSIIRRSFSRVRNCIVTCLLQVQDDDSRISDPQCTIISSPPPILPTQELKKESILLLATNKQRNRMEDNSSNCADLTVLDEQRPLESRSFVEQDVVIERLTSTPIKGVSPVTKLVEPVE